MQLHNHIDAQRRRRKKNHHHFFPVLLFLRNTRADFQDGNLHISVVYSLWTPLSDKNVKLCKKMNLCVLYYSKVEAAYQEQQNAPNVVWWCTTLVEMMVIPYYLGTRDAVF